MQDGQRIGRYELRALLGRGGMGQVWRAFDPQLGREVALKLLLQKRLAAKHAERFRREAQALARIQHPNVIRIHDADLHGGSPFLVVELVEGGSLQTQIDTGTLKPERALELTAKLASALHATHLEGLLHRDVKPDNVLLRPNGEPVLTDFGLALHTADDRLTQTGVFVGTPGYLAPEQAQGKSHAAVDARVDLYALGALLYACLTGEPPHGRLPALQQLVAAERLPPPPSQLRTGLPRACDAICLRCLQPDPAARYPDMAALEADLRAALAGRGVKAPARGRGRTLAGVAVLALVASGAWFALRGDPSHEPSTPGPAPEAHPSPEPPESEPESEPEQPQPDRAPDTAPEPEWSSAEEALAEGLALAGRDHHDSAIVALEFAIAGDLDPQSRIRGAIHLAKSLLHGKLSTSAQIAEGERRVERARDLWDAIESWAGEIEDELSAMTARVALRSELEKPLWIRRSEVLSAQKRPEDALRLIREIQVQNRDSLIVTLRIAECLWDLERYDELWRETQRLLDDYPKYARDDELLRIRYDACGKLGRHADKDPLAEVLCEVSDNGWFFMHSIRARERGDYAQALARYEAINARLANAPSLELSEERARLAYLLGLDAFERGRIHSTELLERAPGNLIALEILAETAQLRSDNRTALATAERFLKHSPGSPVARVLRARALWRLDRLSEAVHQVRLAVTAKPALAETSLALVVEAHCLRGLKRDAELKEVALRLRASSHPFLRRQGKDFLGVRQE